MSIEDILGVQPPLDPNTVMQLKAALEQDPPRIPITQVTGYASTIAQMARVVATTNTYSPAWQDLGGPQITGLPPGQYVCLYGAGCYISLDGGTPHFGISANGGTPSVDVGVTGLLGPGIASMMGELLSLTQGNNTLLMKYHSATDTLGTWYYQRWIVAWRVSNLSV